MSGKIYVVNVGTNASHLFCSPIFEDGTFEFIPIPEDRQIDGAHGVQYRDLRSFYSPTEDLSEFIPDRFLDVTTHNDPEFDSFTYGDNCDVNARARALRGVERGDFLFFLARLQNYRKELAELTPLSEFGFYFVGFIHVDRIYRSVTDPLSTLDLEPINLNAHVRRAMTDDSLWDSFWVFCGSSWSRRFKKAVPVTRELCEKIFTSADGSPWRWGGGRTDLQVIGSYTRTCRCAIDPSAPDGLERESVLWDWIDRF